MGGRRGTGRNIASACISTDVVRSEGRMYSSGQILGCCYTPWYTTTVRSSYSTATTVLQYSTATTVLQYSKHGTTVQQPQYYSSTATTVLQYSSYSTYSTYSTATTVLQYSNHNPATIVQ